MSNDIITVHVTKFGSDRGGSVELSGSAKVRDALSQLGIDASGCKIRVNSKDSHLDSELYEGSKVVISAPVEGN